jgi:hypothetical protein
VQDIRLVHTAFVISRVAVSVFFIATLSALADETQVTLRVRTSSPESGMARRWVVRAESVSAQASQRDIVVGESGVATISLPRGQWFAFVDAPDFWCEPVLVDVGERPAEADVVVYPAGKVSANVGKHRQATVYFQAIGAQSPAAGSVACPAADEQIACRVPAGTYDLAFRVPGHASTYKFGIAIAHGGAVDVGSLRFQRGSTLSGRVEPVKRGVATEVVLVPVASAANDALRHRAEVARQVARPNERGIFVFNVPGGEYNVFARAGSLVSETSEVTVVEGEESVLRAPLVLEPRRSLAVNVIPATDPANRPWTVVLTRMDREGHVRARSHRTVDATGACRFEQELPGAIHVSVQRSAADRWASMDVDLMKDASIDIHVPLVQVRGAVTLGEEPLRARLVFREPAAGFSIPVQTRPDGTFALTLPRPKDGDWDKVSVEGNDIRVSRTVERVKVVDGDPAALSIELPATRLDGKVVTENRAAATHALVNVRSEQGAMFQQIESADGTFSMEGLEPGRYQFTAMTRDAETAEPVDVVVGEHPSAIELVVRGVAQFKGVVRSAGGTVTNAAVFAMPTADRSRLITQHPVDMSGAFDIVCRTRRRT